MSLVSLTFAVWTLGLGSACDVVEPDQALEIAELRGTHSVWLEPTEVRPLGTFGDRDYTYMEGMMNGTVGRGHDASSYSVGFVLIFPELGGNGTAVVDWPNSAYYYLYDFDPREEMTIDFTRRTLDDHLFEEGYTYLSVQWNKAVTEMFGPEMPDDGEPHNPLVYGDIERASGGYEILKDAANFLRRPRPIPGARGPAASDVVISSGYSMSAQGQHEFLSQGYNVQADGSNAYDGFLVGFKGLRCFRPNEEAPAYGATAACEQFPSGGDAKVILVQSQTDVELIDASLSRGDGTDPNWVQYELAGVSHLPTPVLDVSEFGATRQNPADPRPFFQKSLDNLTEWVRDGTEPPPAQYIEGERLPNGIRPSVVDADGNAVGGIRLPHVPSEADGGAAGAPAGTYTAFEPAGAVTDDRFLLLGGTFDRFTDAELAVRYPTRDDYVDAVVRAAESLAGARYIAPGAVRKYRERAEQNYGVWAH